MNSVAYAYDYDFSPHSDKRTRFHWEYSQQRNTMAANLETVEQELLQQSATAQLYAFTKTVNALPREQAALLKRNVILQVAENIRRMPASNDAKMAAMNIYYSKFGK